MKEEMKNSTEQFLICSNNLENDKCSKKLDVKCITCKDKLICFNCAILFHKPHDITLLIDNSQNKKKTKIYNKESEKTLVENNNEKLLNNSITDDFLKKVEDVYSDQYNKINMEIERKVEICINIRKLCINKLNTIGVKISNEKLLLEKYCENSLEEDTKFIKEIKGTE